MASSYTPGPTEYRGRSARRKRSFAASRRRTGWAKTSPWLGDSRAKVDRSTKSGQPSLVGRHRRTANSGAVAGRQHPRHARALPLVDLDHRPAQVLVIAEPAARQTEQLGRSHKAVADTDRVDGHPLFGARHHPPVGVHGSMDHLLHPAVTLRPHHYPAVPQRHAAAQQLKAVGGPVAQEGEVARSGRQQPEQRAWAGGRPGFERQHDVDAVVAQLGRESKGQRAAPGERHPVPRDDPGRLHHGLSTPGRDHAGERPTGENDRPVVRPRRHQDPSRWQRGCSGRRAVAVHDGRGASQRDDRGPGGQLGPGLARRTDQLEAPAEYRGLISPRSSPRNPAPAAGISGPQEWGAHRGGPCAGPGRPRWQQRPGPQVLRL